MIPQDLLEPEDLVDHLHWDPQKLPHLMVFGSPSSLWSFSEVPCRKMLSARCLTW